MIDVPLPRRPIAQLEPVIGMDRYARLSAAAGLFRERLAGRTVWNINSTAVGGGVAEMLQVLVGYAQGADIDVRWLVHDGDPEFFAVTKRLHHRVHGQPGDGGPLDLHRAEVVAETLPAPTDALVTQVSRWDPLKDMAGVMHGFAAHVAGAEPAAYLALVGPAVSGVSDDPEGAEVYAKCVAEWRALPAAARSRIILVTLPLDDVDENGAMVNALQRHAAVIVQKSLAEGFGLTVAEGMWKGRPVVGSAVGGIQDQVIPGTGVLLTDPTDLAGFGAAVRELLARPQLADRIGAAAHAHVRDHFIGDLHLLRYAELFDTLIGGQPADRRLSP